VWIAEQVYVDVSVTPVLRALGSRSSAWLKPFLAVAWHDAAAARGGQNLASSAPHRLRLGEWRAIDDVHVTEVTWLGTPDGPFARLIGEVTLAACGRGSSMRIEGEAIGAEPDPFAGASAFRPAELAVRSLLGHMRSAIEQTSSSTLQ
jgi:hypothetical protein